MKNYTWHIRDLRVSHLQLKGQGHLFYGPFFSIPPTLFFPSKAGRKVWLIDLLQTVLKLEKAQSRIVKTRTKKYSKGPFSQDVKLTDKLLMVYKVKISVFPLGVVGVGKFRGCSV